MAVAFLCLQFCMLLQTKQTEVERVHFMITTSLAHFLCSSPVLSPCLQVAQARAAGGGWTVKGGWGSAGLSTRAHKERKQKRETNETLDD